jgi:hypothetical protein
MKKGIIVLATGNVRVRLIRPVTRPIARLLVSILALIVAMRMAVTAIRSMKFLDRKPDRLLGAVGYNSWKYLGLPDSVSTPANMTSKGK